MISVIQRAVTYLECYDDEHSLSGSSWQSKELIDLVNEMHDLVKFFDEIVFSAEVKFPSGYVLNASNGYIAIDPDLEVATGFDRMQYDLFASPDDFDKTMAASYDQKGTLEDKKYLAKYMIALWSSYLDKVNEQQN